MFNRRNKFNKGGRGKNKVFIWLVLFLFVFNISVGVGYPTEARAFGIGDIFQFIWNLVKIPADFIWHQAAVIDNKIRDAGGVAWKHALQRFLNNVAYRSAIELSTAMTGQKPVFKDDWWEWVKSQGDGALGDYLNNTVGKMWGKDLCEPLNPLIKVKVGIVARNILKPQGKASCKFTTITEKVGKLQIKNLVNFSSYFDPNSNEIGALMTIVAGGEEARRKEMEKAKWEQQLSGDLLAIKTKITDKIITPATMIRADITSIFGQKYTAQTKYTDHPVADAIGIFGNTLASKLMEYVYKKGFNPWVTKNKKSSGSTSGGSGGNYSPSFLGGGDGMQAAREQFSDLAQVDYTYGGSFNILSQLICDTEGQFSCAIDEQLRTAIEQKMTVRQALDQNLLRGNWPFGFRADKSGGISTIKNSIYSWRILKILRKYRIIPVGWELAAEYYEKYDRSGDTLVLEAPPGTANVISLVDEFNNPLSPYYKLVDSAWILKASDSVCRRKGSGEMTIGGTIDISVDLDQDGEVSDEERNEMPIRQDYCGDERACIQENENGSSCDYYGYCVEEKPIWRIDGDECSAVYNTCKTYKTRNGGIVSYLSNTLSGRDVCADDQAVGCREYCAQKDIASGQWICTLDTGDRRYINKNAEECSEEDESCSNFIRMSSSLGVTSNWVPNSSFEYFQDEENIVNIPFEASNHSTGFTRNIAGSGVYTDDNYDGQYALSLGGGSFGMTINTGDYSLANREFVLSVYYKGDISLSLEGEPSEDFDPVNDWQQASMSYQFNLSGGNEISFIINDEAGNSIIDGVLLAEGESDYYRSYGSQNQVSLKKAPDYLGCVDYTTVIDNYTNQTLCEDAGYYWRSDIDRCVQGGNEECDNYALYCGAEDADCKIYNPVSYRGVEIPGVVGPTDQCPAECVGYNNYLEQPSFFEPEVPAGRNPVSLIPATARTCPASANGCEEFTNLSEGGAGERKEYYTYLRACIEKDDARAESYYSWESSDTGGSRGLREWKLLPSNLSDPINGGSLPCTNIVTDADGYVECDDSDNPDDSNYWHLCFVGDSNVDDNPLYNPDCVEFEDRDGNQYWIKQSRVVFATDDCSLFRRTYDQNYYSAVVGLSTRCDASENGCREYKGSTSNNIYQIFYDDFESVSAGATADLWNPVEGWVAGTVSNVSLQRDGQSLSPSGNNMKEITGEVHQGRSYRLSFWARARTIGQPVEIGQIFIGGDNNGVAVETIFDDFENNNVLSVDNWNQYIVNLSNLDREIVNSEWLVIEASGAYYVDNIRLVETKDDLYLIKDSWVTPLACETDPPLMGGLAAESMLGCEHYQDEDEDDWYLKSFTRLCRDEVVGCELLIDTYNSSVPFEQSYMEDNDDIRDNVMVARDETVFLVYDRDKTCKDAGCIGLGMIWPTISDPSLFEFETKYFKINPDQYSTQSTPLCYSSQNWCDRYSYDEGYENFKDPHGFVCEYKKVDNVYGWYTEENNPCSSVVIGGVQREKGIGYCSNNHDTVCTELTSLSDCGGAPCVVERFCLGGTSMLNSSFEGSEINTCGMGDDCTSCSTSKCSEGGVCTDWVSKCDPAQNSCALYQDPSRPEYCDNQSVDGENYHPTGDADWVNTDEHCDYYYYLSDSIQICDEPDQAEGCIPLYGVYSNEENIWYSTPRCSVEPYPACEVDADCQSLETALGVEVYCTYRPIEYQIVN